MQAIRAKTAAWWQGRSSRERTILLAWGGVATILLLWFAVISPLRQRINQLEQRVPELESKLYLMRAHPLNEVRVQSVDNKSAADLRSTLFRLLADKKISAELRALSASRVEMRLPELPMKEALDLLESLRQESGARIVVLNAKTDAASSATSRLVVELERAS
jgi:type II secretory pathway component PulM